MLVLTTSPFVSETFVALAGRTLDCECVLVVAVTGCFCFVETCTLLPASSDGVVASLPTASATSFEDLADSEVVSTIEMSVINLVMSAFGSVVAADDAADVSNDLSPGKTAGRLIAKSVSLDATTLISDVSVSLGVSLLTEADGAAESVVAFGNGMNNGSSTASEVAGVDGSLIAESATEVGVVIFGVVCVAVSAKPVVVVSVVLATATNNASLVALCIISRLLYQSKTIISFLY